jgi:hypothetical protein
MKTARIHIASEVVEKELLWRLAQLEGECPSVVLRRLIREAGERRGLWPIEPGTDTPEVVLPADTERGVRHD